jgi:hypothetical protein
MYSTFFEHIVCQLVASRVGVELVSLHVEVRMLIGWSSEMWHIVSVIFYWYITMYSQQNIKKKILYIETLKKLIMIFMFYMWYTHNVCHTSLMMVNWDTSVSRHGLDFKGSLLTGKECYSLSTHSDWNYLVPSHIGLFSWKQSHYSMKLTIHLHTVLGLTVHKGSLLMK